MKPPRLKVVRFPDGTWRITRGDLMSDAFDNWADAMACADELARSINVTLPPEEYVWESGIDSDGRHYVTDRWDHEICYYPNGDENGEGTLKEIALYFLAYAYKTTNKEN